MPDIEKYIGHKIPVDSVPHDLPREDLVRPPRRPRKKTGGRPPHGNRGGGRPPHRRRA